MASPGSQARGFHDAGRLGRSSRSNSTTGSSSRPMEINPFTGQPQQVAASVQNPFAPGQGGGRDLTAKQSQGGAKPGEDLQAQAQAAIPNKPLSDVEKALLEARRQRAALSTGVTVGAAIAPSLIGSGLTLGNWMGKQAEDDAAANPERYTVLSGVPGGIKSTSGPLTSNRALSAPSAKSTEAGGEKLDKKKKALPTLLGAPAQALGTYSNPVMIT